MLVDADKELFIYFYWFIIFFNQKSKIYSVYSKTCFDISTIISYEFVYGCDSQADCRTRALCDGQVFRSVEGFCDLWKCFLFYNFFGLFDLFVCLFVCFLFVWGFLLSPPPDLVEVFLSSVICGHTGPCSGHMSIVESVCPQSYQRLSPSSNVHWVSHTQQNNTGKCLGC